MYVGDCARLGTLYLSFAHSWSGTDEHYLHCSDSGDVIYVLYIAMCVVHVLCHQISTLSVHYVLTTRGCILLCSAWVYIGSSCIFIYRDCNCVPNSRYIYIPFVNSWLLHGRLFKCVYIWHWNTQVIAPLPICLSAGNLVPRHVKTLTLGFVPLDLMCDVVEYLEHVEDLNCFGIQSPQQVRLSTNLFASFWYTVEGKSVMTSSFTSGRICR